MYCKNCGTQLKDGVKFCHACGTAIEIMEPIKFEEPIEINEPVEIEIPVETAEPFDFEIPIEVYETVEPVETIQPTIVEPQKNTIPPEYQPMGAWSFFWLRILFAIPVVGLVFLIIFSFSGGNLSRRSFARSYWCGLLIVGIAFLAVLSLYLILISIGAGVLGYGMYY